MEARRVNDRLKKHLWEMLPMALIAAALIFYFILSAIQYTQIDAALPALDAWQVNGAAVESLPDFDPKQAGEITLLSNTLGTDFSATRTICFYSVYENVTVSLDGAKLYARRKNPADKLIRAAESGWNIVVLPGGCTGKTLEIELSTPYQRFANRINEIRYGSNSQITDYVLMKTAPKFVAALGILFIGVVFSIIAIFLRYHLEGNTGLYSLSLFIVVLAIFLASQQTYLLHSLYEGSPYILIQNISFMLCPVMYTRYQMRVHTGMQRKISVALHAVSILNLALISALHLLRVRDMPEMMSSTQNLCAIIVVYSFVLEVSNHRRVIIFASGLLMSYALYRYYRTGTITWLVYPAIFVYIYIMVYRVINTVVRSKAQEIRLGAALEVSKSELKTVQITSHFFYHTLDSIRALIRIDADKAYKMTGDFAKYARYRVDGVERMEETVSFSRELRSIRAYTDIKQAQLGARFSMIFDVDTQEFEILPLTVQPLVENAVIHAVQKRSEGGEVILRVRETQKGYQIEVIDNGAGPGAVETKNDEQRTSTAINNVNTRLEYYGIAPVKLEPNELGGMTASLISPKQIAKKEKSE